MSSQPNFTIFPRLPMELRLRIWQQAFPTIDNSNRTIRIDITYKAKLITPPSATYPTKVAWSYTLTAPSAPPPPPLINRELHLENLRRYPSTLELLPDPNPLHPTQPTPHQRIRFNPARDTIFIPLPTLYSFSNILSSPPSLQTLNRLVGFDQILNLSIPLKNPNIRGLAFPESWLFTSLPPCPSPSLPSPNNNKDTAVKLHSKIHTDLTFATSSPETDMRSAFRLAAQDMIGNLAYPNPTPSQVRELAHRARRHHVWRPLQGMVSIATQNFYTERGALGVSAAESLAVRELADSLVLGMKEDLWEFFEEGEQLSGR